MARRSSTPLYELIMSGRRPGSIRTPEGLDYVSEEQVEPEEELEEVEEELEEEYEPAVIEHETPSLGPARTVRVPMGYLLLAAAAVVVGLAGAYMIGAWQGARAERAELDQALLANSPGGHADDPLSGPVAARPEELDRAPGIAAPPPRDERVPVSVPVLDERGWGPVNADPRQADRHYLVLAETRPEGALRLAEFAREEGLETYVITSNNPRFRRVIALPGLPSGSEVSPEMRGLRERVRRVGQAWKARYPGESDLSDAYPITGSQ
ncbi:MAG: hypothetical protein GY715_21250 [Planctomycetes bacterium]|nr:hypothetical protein [Planctomycetota bacterium]